jgi:hypothetical protein
MILSLDRKGDIWYFLYNASIVSKQLVGERWISDHLEYNITLVEASKFHHNPTDCISVFFTILPVPMLS